MKMSDACIPEQDEDRPFVGNQCSLERISLMEIYHVLHDSVVAFVLLVRSADASVGRSLCLNVM